MAAKKHDPLAAAVEQLQRELLRKVLEESDWDVAAAAKRLGITRTRRKGPPRSGPPAAAAVRRARRRG